MGTIFKIERKLEFHRIRYWISETNQREGCSSWTASKAIS